jgi:hypothetical protein
MSVGGAVSPMGWRQGNNQLVHKQVPGRKRGSCLAVKRVAETTAPLDTMKNLSIFTKQTL